MCFQNRFQCAKRTMRVAPVYAAIILKAAAILHNFLIMKRDDWPIPDANENEDANAGEDAVAPNDRLEILNNAFLNINII